MADWRAGAASRLATVSTFALAFSSPAVAQTGGTTPAAQQVTGPAVPQGTGPSDAAMPGQDIVVTGTRRNDLTAAESPTPIDIISSAQLLNKGTSDVNDLLREQVPSFNVQRFVSNDGAVFTRPFSLRNLPPDETLVLVNGKRWHRGATVQFTNIPYIRGSQGPDLAAIPSISIGQLEVLRDGASAQYGSDAIAGVLNFRLRDDAHGGTLIARYGQFYAGDGQDVLVQGNIGLPLTAAGFINVSGEYTNSNITSRQIQRPDAQALIDAGVPGVPVPAQRWGNPDTEAARMFVNAGLDLSDTTRVYLFGNYSWSEGTTAFFYRSPDTTFIATSIPLTNQPGGPRFSFRSKYPGGFTPNFGATIRDASIVGGMAGKLIGELTYDVSASYGTNIAQYRIDNTVNPSLGLSSPTSFNVGKLQQQELNFNFDTTYPLEVGFEKPLSLAGGLEYRRETYEITAGEIASWQVGPFASVVDPDTGKRTGLPVGSNGFPGFSPIQSGVFSRDNWATYASLEGDVSKLFTFGLAGRYEDFSDFGSTFNWKVNARFNLSDAIAIRGSVNTGFRAPTPGQANASSVQTNIDSVTGAPLTAGIVGPNNPVAQFFGAKPLKPEKSFNIAAGVVLTPSSRLTVTIDYFNIKVKDRIALSGNFNLTQAQRDQLAALGIPGGDSFQQISFFTNSFDSRNQGIDAVASYRFPLAAGQATFSVNANYTNTKILHPSPVIAADRERLLELEHFVPEWKGNATFTYEGDRIGVTATATYYGKWTDYGANLANDQTGGAELVADLELRYRVNDHFRLAVGAENILDNYPDREMRASQIANGIKYLRFSPIGFNGGFWYVRGTAKF